MKIKFKLYKLILLIFLTIDLSGQKVSIKLGANESPPFWSKTMPFNGMGGEIIRAISNEVSINSIIEFFPLIRLIEDDTNNDLGNPMFYMKNQDFEAIIPIAIYNIALFYYKPNLKKEIDLNLENLKKYKIGILKGTLINRSYFEKVGFDFEESYSQKSLFKKLKAGRIDLCLEVDLVGHTIINKLFATEVANFKSILIPNSSSPIAIMISETQRSAKEFGEKYQEGLNKIIANGKYEKILKKYYGGDNFPKNWFEELDKFKKIYNFSLIK